jgi:hypothetical protein
MIFMRVFRSSSKRDAARTSFTQLLLYHLAKPKKQMFFLLALGKCATRKAMRAGENAALRGVTVLIAMKCVCERDRSDYCWFR